MQVAIPTPRTGDTHCQCGARAEPGPCWLMAWLWWMLVAQGGDTVVTTHVLGTSSQPISVPLSNLPGQEPKG